RDVPPEHFAGLTALDCAADWPILARGSAARDPCAALARARIRRSCMSNPRTNTTSRSTTGAGAPAPSDRNSLTIGPDGPIVLHDVHFLEQMAHFNREKVPERQPHAKGSGAFGVFETSEDMSAYTKAALFQKGAATEMLAR